MEKIKAIELNENWLKLISKDWGVLTVNCHDKVNAMTVSWVQMGHLWNKDVVSVYVRPQRYTFSHLVAQDTFSLCFFDDQWRNELRYLGSESGRNTDKLEKCKFTTSSIHNTPIINQAKIVFVCKKIYVHDLKEDEFIDKATQNDSYPDKDFHRVFIGEILNVFVNE